MQEKTINNLLLHCEVAGALCDDFFGRIALAWVMPVRVVELLASWRSLLEYFTNCNSLEDGLYLSSIVYLEGNK